MSALRWLPLAVLPPCAVLVTLALESCGSLCGRAEPRSDCPCAPGEGDSATSGGGNDDGGCGRALKVRCECGVTGGDSGGDADTEATEDTDATTDATTDTTGDAVCDVDTPVTLYLSADDSNSMSSPVQARIAALSDWFSLGAVPIRPWEFFNYYDFDYPAAPPGEVALFMEMIPNAAEVGAYTLQIGVSSEVYDQEPRPPVTVTFVLDTSGSMAGAPIEALREVCRAITASLRAGDRVSMVTWNSENTIVLDDYPVIGPQDPTLLDAIAGLEAGGSTDLHGGLSAGYALASKSAGPGRRAGSS
ncbi:MAG: VWA domain-containing protein [Nannocystaceae bacterium]